MEKKEEVSMSKKVLGGVIVVILIAVGVFMMTGDKTGDPNVSASSKKDAVVFSISSEPSSLDPARTKDAITYLVIYQMFDTLIREEPDGTLAPALAESWEISDDTKQITFKIRDGVKFHNGETMTVDDVAYSINRAIASVYTSAYTNTMDRMEVIDSSTVKLYLKEPYIAILKCLTNANLAIVPKSVAETAGDEFSKTPIGTGPYKFISWDNGEKITMVRFDEYYRGAAKIKDLTFKIQADKSTAAIALEKGEIDVLYYPSTSDRQHLMSLENVSYKEGPASTFWYVAFNNRKGPFANEKLRKAVCYALDRDAIILGGADGLGDPIEGCIPASVQFYNPDFKGYERDLEKAKQLMAEAGYPNGLSFAMKTNQSSQYSKPTEVIQAQLREIGIEANIELMERAAYLDETQVKCDYDMTFYVITNTISDPDYIATRRFHSQMEGGGNNFTLHKIDGLDELIDSARGDRNDETRGEKYRKIEQLIYEHAVIAPLYQGKTFIACNSKLKGVYTHPSERHYVYEYSWSD